MRKYRTVAQAMEACQNYAANKVTPACEEGLKHQEAHGSWSGSTPRNQETMSLVNATNQESKDSLSANSSENLTSCPESVLLLEKYGDIMGVVDNHPAFKRAIVDWDVFPQALTEACKRHGLDVVLDAIRYTANYPAAKHKGRFLFAVLKNGKKAKR